MRFWDSPAQLDAGLSKGRGFEMVYSSLNDKQKSFSDEDNTGHFLIK